MNNPAKLDRWASRPRQCAAVSAGIAAVIGLVAAPWLTLQGLVVLVAAGVLYAGVRSLVREQRARQTDPAADHAEAEQPPCRCAGVGFGGNGDCPVHDDLTAQEARDLADDLGLQLYRAQDALDFVSEMCDIADEHRGVRGQPATVTTARVREWLKGAQCARQSGLVLTPDASGQDPDAIRTDPDTTGHQDAEQAGHDPDTLRTRLADALREDPNADWAYLTARATEIREGRDRADTECTRLSRMVDNYSTGARGMGDKLRRLRDVAYELADGTENGGRAANAILDVLDSPAAAPTLSPAWAELAPQLRCAEDVEAAFTRAWDLADQWERGLTADQPYARALRTALGIVRVPVDREGRPAEGSQP